MEAVVDTVEREALAAPRVGDAGGLVYWVVRSGSEAAVSHPLRFVEDAVVGAVVEGPVADEVCRSGLWGDEDWGVQDDATVGGCDAYLVEAPVDLVAAVQWDAGLVFQMGGWECVRELAANDENGEAASQYLDVGHGDRAGCFNGQLSGGCVGERELDIDTGRLAMGGGVDPGIAAFGIEAGGVDD